MPDERWIWECYECDRIEHGAFEYDNLAGERPVCHGEMVASHYVMAHWRETAFRYQEIIDKLAMAAGDVLLHDCAETRQKLQTLVLCYGPKGEQKDALLQAQ